MRRAVLPHPDRVVCEDVDDRDLHQRGEPNRATRVVGEDEEARPERAELGDRQAVRDRRGCMLADPEVEVPAAAVVRLEVARAVEGQAGLRGGREIGRAAEKPGNVLRDRVQDLPGRVAAGDPLRIGGKLRDVRIPTSRELPALHALDLVCELGIGSPIVLEQRPPRLAAKCS